MTQDQFNREKEYQLAVSVFKRMLNAGILTLSEYKAALVKAAIEFRPVWGFLPDIVIGQLS